LIRRSAPKYKIIGEDLQTAEGDIPKLITQLFADPDYQKLVADAQELLVAGGVRDDYFRSLPRN
jgi:hypothetical protein